MAVLRHGRAHGLFRPRVLDMVIGEAGLLLANKVVGVLIAAPVLAVLIWAAVPAQALLPVAIMAGVGVLILQEAVMGFVRTAYYTCPYLWAVAMEAAGSERVPAPERLAKALYSPAPTGA